MPIRHLDPEVAALTTQMMGLVSQAQALAGEINETFVTLEEYKNERVRRVRRRKRAVGAKSEGK